jgi:hypothetical protein
MRHENGVEREKCQEEEYIDAPASSAIDLPRLNIEDGGWAQFILV